MSIRRRHVCTHEETVTRPIRVVESYCKPAYKSFTQLCSNGTMCTAFRYLRRKKNSLFLFSCGTSLKWPWKCLTFCLCVTSFVRHRVQYDTIYRTVVKYQTTTEKKHACCPGWTHTVKHTHGCLQGLNQPFLIFARRNQQITKRIIVLCQCSCVQQKLQKRRHLRQTQYLQLRSRIHWSSMRVRYLSSRFVSCRSCECESFFSPVVLCRSGRVFEQQPVPADLHQFSGKLSMLLSRRLPTARRWKNLQM